MPLTKIISDMLTFGSAVEGDVLSFIGSKWIPKKVSGVPAGAMMSFAGGTAPEDWLLCDGSAIDRTTYAALFTAIGTSFGIGDGSTTFNLPDFRGRTSVGMDNMGGASANRITNAQADTLGGTGGLENKTPNGSIGGSTGSTTLSSSQIPSHQHNQRWVNQIGSTTWNPAGVSLIDMNYPVSNDGSNQVYNYVDTDIINSASGVSAADAPVTTNVAGGSGSHNHTLSASFTGSSMDVTQPWLACNMIIKI